MSHIEFQPPSDPRYNFSEAMRRSGELSRHAIDTLPLSDFVSYLDTHTAKEGLSPDWYTLGNRVGFSMKTQMELFHEHARDPLSLWVQRTEQDIRGFCLEYLAGRLVYPYHYENKEENGKEFLFDPIYQKKMVATASEKERNGSVVAGLTDIETFLLHPDTPEGSVVTMVSPLGSTGLEMDGGTAIQYPDSYMFLFEKQKGQVGGFAIRTDFTKAECREFIKRMTGHALSPLSREEDYVRALSYRLPSSGEIPREKVLNELRKVRSDLSWNSPYAYKEIAWEEVLADISKQDVLYAFDRETNDIISAWRAYSTSVDVSRPDSLLALQKGLAATLLRLGKVFVTTQLKREQRNDIQWPKGITPKYVLEQDTVASGMGFGDIEHAMSLLGGCAGGGREPGLDGGLKTLVESILQKYAVVIDGAANVGECPTIKCKGCGWTANENEVSAIQSGSMKECPHCGWSPGGGNSTPPHKEETKEQNSAVFLQLLRASTQERHADTMGTREESAAPEKEMQTES